MEHINRLIVRDDTETRSYIYNITVEEVICKYLLNDLNQFNPNFEDLIIKDEVFQKDNEYMVATDNTVTVNYDSNEVVIWKYVSQDSDKYVGMDNLVQGYLYYANIDDLGTVIEQDFMPHNKEIGGYSKL